MTSFQLWCAAAVNVCEGRTKDGGTVVGAASIFYDKPNEQPVTGSSENEINDGSPIRRLSQVSHFEISFLLRGRP